MSAPLDQMAYLICTELGVYDNTSIQLCKFFLNRQYQTLWDKYPWKDATGYGGIQVPANAAIVTYPANIDRIISILLVRSGTGADAPIPPDPAIPDIPPPDPPDLTLSLSDSRLLEPVDTTFMMETDPTIFQTTGYLKYYEDIGSFGDRTDRMIRLYPTPDVGVSLLVYGKMICPGLLADTDVVTIRNIEPALMAYAYFDMLQRQRQYGKADVKRKEALELEANAWNLEQQQANLPRRTKATTVAGNSLAEMTDAVCTICGQWTPDYRLIIREFLRRNYQALYDLYLWPESLVMVRVPYTTEQVVMPAYIDKVLGVRGTNNLRMFPADAGLILDITPSAFDEIGTPISYTTLTPVGVSTLPATTTRLVLASTNTVDTTPVVLRGEILATGAEVEEIIRLNGTTPVTSTFSYDIPLTVSKDITLGYVSVNAENDMLSLEVIPSYLRELKHQRLWVLPAPDSTPSPDTNGHGVSPTFTCLVLGKRAIKPLLTDQDTPIITGVQQVLIAASAADVFRKLEKPDQATAFAQKASTSTEVLKAKNTDQAASAPRFVPQVEPSSYRSEFGCVW